MQTIRIQGIDYTIIEFDGDIDVNLMGREAYDKAKIFIKKDMPDGKKRETLLHEILHIIYANTYLMKGDDEERIVGALSAGLHQVLEENSFYRDCEDLS
jgi:hypothetical protein